MPPGTIIPEVAYADVVAAAAWLCNAFGFTERLRIGDHRIQLRFGDGSVVAVRRSVSFPGTENGSSIMVRVEDVGAHHERARQRGVRIIQPPADHPYGERQYTAEDPAGHRWTFSQSIADVDPAEWGGVLVEQEPESGFLASIVAPARRALEREGITTLARLSQFSEDEVLGLHGMGPSTIPKLRNVLKEKGLTFREK